MRALSEGNANGQGASSMAIIKYRDDMGAVSESSVPAQMPT
jgi:hypothetical protein